MSFAQGLTAGSQMAQGWIEAYESADEKKRRRLAQEEISKLGKSGIQTEAPVEEAQPTPQPSIMRQPAPQPTQELGSGTYGMEDYSGGMGVRGGLAPTGAAPVAPQQALGQPRQQPVAPQAQAPAQPAPAQGLTRGTPNADRLMQEAEIYAKNGLTEQAVRARERAYEVGRQEKADSRVEEEYITKKNNQKAIGQLGEVLAKGEEIDLPTIYKTAQANGADPTVLTAFVGDSLGITEKMATAKVNKMARDVQAASSDPVKLNEYIRKNADPNPNDNIIPELRQVRGGWAIMYGDKLLPGTQVYPDSREVPGFTAMAYDMVEKAKGNVLGWAIQKQSMEKNAAAIRASDASAGLSSERLTTLKEERENRNEAAKIKDEYEALSDTEKMGPKGQGLVRKYNMTNAKAGGQVSLGAQARPGKTMTDVETENLRAYRDWEKEDRNARLPQAEKDKKATQMGVYQFVNPTANVVESGLGSNPYANTGANTGAKGGAAKQQGVQTKTPQINSMNTKLISRAGNMGYNVELPDGSTRVMEQDELEDLGYRFPKGSGLSRPWYSDLMPR